MPYPPISKGNPLWSLLRERRMALTSLTCAWAGTCLARSNSWEFSGLCSGLHSPLAAWSKKELMALPKSSISVATSVGAIRLTRLKAALQS